MRTDAHKNGERTRLCALVPVGMLPRLLSDTAQNGVLLSDFFLTGTAKLLFKGQIASKRLCFLPGAKSDWEKHQEKML